MTSFDDLFEYNAWANREILAVTDLLTGAELAAPMDDLGGSALQLLDHTAQVEAAFLAVMTARARPPREERPYAKVRSLLEANADGYRAALPTLTGRLAETFELEWFGRRFTVEQGLMQVVTHSVQHRAGVAAGIARAGREAPGLDYIMWLARFR
ncbi:MAG: DinB family protein [Dehalococcoidia bacterium]|nr:DinB family protein [Dehalococcoidia bacterium]